MTARGPNAQRLFWLASLMFLLSGGTGLVYQVIWFKRFAHVWGSSSLSFASVGGSFLFGLGLGAYVAGRFSDRVARPLRWYGICECSIGALAILIPWVLNGLIVLSAGFYSYLPQEPLLRYLVQFLVTLGVIGSPCVLMGATLPLVIRELTARDGSIDQATGWLYAINTFGAAAGCFAAGFFLLPAAGLLWTNYLCAGLNVLIGMSAIAVAAAAPGRTLRGAGKRAAKAVSGESWNWSLAGLYLATALSGLGALVLEMTWSRQLALVLGGSTYAYSATLFVVLLGIALGSLVFHLALRPIASWPSVPIGVITALAVSCLLGKWMLPTLSLAVGEYQSLRTTLAGNALVCGVTSLALEFVPSLAMGILFPLFVHLTRQTAAAVGRAVGDVYAWNTLGSIAGASLTSVLLFPSVGTAGSVALATGLYVVALVLVLPLRGARQTAVAAGTVVAGALIVGGILVPQDPMLTNMGMYMYGPQAEKMAVLEELYFAEGASSNVFVSQSRGGLNVNLRVNGKVDASDGLDMETQLGSAYFPRVFQPAAKEVLVIGFGSGTTSGASLLFPGTHVTCCEIEPAVYRASPFFAHINHRPQEKSREFLLQKKRESLSAGEELSSDDLAEIDRQARYTIVFGDGRTALQGSDKKYDIIISEPSNPWLAGVANLFTQEFFRAAFDHLNEGGVLAQWIQTYSFTWSDYLMVVRTLRSVFPHYGMIMLAQGADTMLLASKGPLVPDETSVAQVQKMIDASPEMTADMRKWFKSTDIRLALLRHYKANDAVLGAKLGRDGPDQMNTDLNLRLEFEAPLHLFGNLSDEQNAQLQIQIIDNAAWRQQLGLALGIKPDGAQYQLLIAEEESTARRYDQAMKHYRRALEIEPHSSEAYRGIAQVYSAQKKFEPAIDVLRELLEVNPDDIEGLRALATNLFALKKDEEAESALLKILGQSPEDVFAIDQLAGVYSGQGDHAKAAETYERLLTLLPKNGPTYAALANAYLALGKPAKAAETYKRFLKLAPKDGPAHGALAECYLAMKRYPEAAAHFREALELVPLRPQTMDAKDRTKRPGESAVPDEPNVVWTNNLAWLLATASDEKIRNGKEAIALATKACEKTGYRFDYLDTLAAAYAEAGEFDEAVKLAQQCVDQAQITRPNMIDAVKNRLKLYQQHKPFRES